MGRISKIKCKVCGNTVKTMCFKDRNLAVCGELHRKVAAGEMTEDEAKRAKAQGYRVSGRTYVGFG